MDAINRCDATGKLSYLEWSPTSDASAKIAAAKIRVLQNGVRELPSIVSSPFGPLPATLTLPPGKAPFPVVLMVSGAGANDQDASVGPNKPFRDLALGLAANGIASLRYDKRVRAYRAESSLAETLTVDDDVTNDATTALQQLEKDRRVDHQRIFLLGHSLGAMMAPRIAERNPALAGMILMAAPGEALIDVFIGQVRTVGAMQGLTAEQIDSQVHDLQMEEAFIAKPAESPPPPEEALRGMPQSWWTSFAGYDPISTTRRLTLPVLVLQGGSDFRVPSQPNFLMWSKAFAGSPRVRLKEFPGLSHIFIAAGILPSPDDYEKPGHVDGRVMAEIADWVRASCNSTRHCR